MCALHVTGNPLPLRPPTLPAPVQEAASGQCWSCWENPGGKLGYRALLCGVSVL